MLISEFDPVLSLSMCMYLRKVGDTGIDYLSVVRHVLEHI